MQEIPQQILSSGRHDGLAVELNPFGGKLAMPQTHHDSIPCLGADLETCRNVGNNQRVVPGRRKTLRQTFEQPLAVMENVTGLTVHQCRSANNLSAEYFADGL